MTLVPAFVVAPALFLIIWFFGAPPWFAFTIAILVAALADIAAAVRALKGRPR